MRAGLVSYFDLSCSYGLTDETFLPEFRNPEADIGLVGLGNPLGQGSTVDLIQVDPDLIRVWRQMAVAEVYRKEMETGWKGEWEEELSKAEFDLRLTELVERHPITVCKITVYAVGTVYIRFEMGSGIDARFMHGVLACFEFAAYRPEVSEKVFEQAQVHAVKSLSFRRTEFSTLTGRPKATTQKDASGREESNLFTSFTHLVLCIDPGDENLAKQFLQFVGMFAENSKPVFVDFEYHGRLYYSWPLCVLQPRGEESWTPEQELKRIMECICIAHVFLGICEAFLRLFQDEINTQVESYVAKRQAGRGPQQLNRLRTLALAVVNLTNFRGVTQADEDQQYFRLFAQDASLEHTHQLLTDAVEVLYNVQDAEAKEDQSRRETSLNVVVVILASLTVVSVAVEAYNFIRGDQAQLIRDLVERGLLLTEFVLVLSLVVAVLIWILARPTHRRKKR